MGARRRPPQVRRLHGLLDRADALDLNDAIGRVADELARFGSTETLDVRRSMAAGELGRSHLTLDFEPDSDTPEDVIDLPARAVAISVRLETKGYQPSPKLRDHVEARDQQFVFPYCTRRRTDLDHAIPHHDGGPTASENLARLCRTHHRAQGRGRRRYRWRYRHLDPGRYQWTSPTGTTHTVDHTTP